jgi:3-phenylpropionate/trans-cinnamate dioxygenase ferredoxin reductase subunit
MAAPSACARATGPSSTARQVLLAVGVAPRTQVAEGVLDVDNGHPRRRLAARERRRHLAAGDVANHDHPLFGRLRCRALGQRARAGPSARARCSARTAVYERVPYFFSDQYDVGMEYAGHSALGDEVVFRGDPAAGASSSPSGCATGA